jgi:hypothetical protein
VRWPFGDHPGPAMRRLLHRVRDWISWIRRPVTLRETYFD